VGEAAEGRWGEFAQQPAATTVALVLLPPSVARRATPPPRGEDLGFPLNPSFRIAT